MCVCVWFFSTSFFFGGEEGGGNVWVFGDPKSPVLHRPQKSQETNFAHFSLNIIENRGLVKIIPKQGVAQYSHRSACVLRTEAPGCHSTQTRTQASLAVAESEARLAMRLLVVDNSGPAAAVSEFATSVMRQLCRPIRLCSRQMSRRISTMKSRRTPPVCSHIAKKRFAGWCILGSTLQLLQSV